MAGRRANNGLSSGRVSLFKRQVYHCARLKTCGQVTVKIFSGFSQSRSGHSGRTRIHIHVYHPGAINYRNSFKNADGRYPKSRRRRGINLSARIHSDLHRILL